MVADKVFEERIRAGRVIRRIAERENIVVASDWKPFNGPKRRVFEFFPENPQKMLPPGVVIGKSEAQALDRALSLSRVHLEKRVPVGVVMLCHAFPRFLELVR
jgi:hypothetical protein